MKAPPRLVDDPTAAPQLRADLERTAATPYAYDAAAGLAGLQAAVGALPAAGAGSAAAAGAKVAGEQAAAAGGSAASTAPPAMAASGPLLGSAGGKIALVAAATAVVAASVIAWPGDAPAPRARTTRAAEAAELAKPAPPTAPAEDVARDAIDAQLARIRARAEHAGDGEATAALRREIAELGRIKALLERRPADAYELAQTGHRRFPAGMLRHEREGLALLALFALERRDEAIARTRAFLARYPASPLRAELEHRLQLAGAASVREKP